MPKPRPPKEPPAKRWFVGIDKRGATLGKEYPSLVDALTDLRDNAAMVNILRMPDRVAMTSRKPMSAAEIESMGKWLRSRT